MDQRRFDKNLDLMLSYLNLTNALETQPNLRRIVPDPGVI